MYFSSSAKQSGQRGFFFDSDKNKPADAIKVKDADVGTTLNLPATYDYDFDAAGKLVITPKPAPTAAQLAAILDTNKTAALNTVDAFHAATVQKLAGNPTQVEKDTWAMKLATANAVAAGTSVSGEGNAFMTANGLNTPALQAAWAAKVLANAANYAGIVGLLDAWRSQAKAAITGAADQAALDQAITANTAAADAAIATIPVV